MLQIKRLHRRVHRTLCCRTAWHRAQNADGKTSGQKQGSTLVHGKSVLEDARLSSMRSVRDQKLARCVLAASPFAGRRGVLATGAYDLGIRAHDSVVIIVPVLRRELRDFRDYFIVV